MYSNGPPEPVELQCPRKVIQVGCQRGQSPADIRCQRNIIQVSGHRDAAHSLTCHHTVYHIVTGLYGREIVAGLRSGDRFTFLSGKLALRSFLVIRTEGAAFAVSSDRMSLEKLAELSASGKLSIDSTTSPSLLRHGYLQGGEAFAIDGSANILRGRLRLVGEMDDFELSAWDDMLLADVDFIVFEGE